MKSQCFDTACPGAAQWQMGVQVWPVGADKENDAPEVVALAFFCCEQHRLSPPPASTLLTDTVRNMLQAGRIANDQPELDFDGAQVVFKQYLTNGGEWHR